MCSARRWCCTPLRACPTSRSRGGLRCPRRSSGSGGEDSPNIGWKVCETNRGRDARGVFPPHEVAQVKAIACELPNSSTARDGADLTEVARVRVTHPFHPWAGQELEFVKRRHNWRADRVYVRGCAGE